MKINTKVRRKHTLKLTDAELGEVVEMLDYWKKHFSDKLPDGGTDAGKLSLYREFYYAKYRHHPEG